jgi:hypothetical protein
MCKVGPIVHVVDELTGPKNGAVRAASAAFSMPSFVRRRPAKRLHALERVIEGLKGGGQTVRNPPRGDGRGREHRWVAIRGSYAMK